MNKTSPPTYTELVKALNLAEIWVDVASRCHPVDQVGIDLKAIHDILDRIREHAPEMLNQSEA